MLLSRAKRQTFSVMRMTTISISGTTTISTFLPSSANPPRQVKWRFTNRADGDLAVSGDPTELAERRARVVPGRWTWLCQVHSSTVLIVQRPGDACGQGADGVVTSASGAILAVHGADCAPVLCWTSDGAVIGAAHAGWRGLKEGVLQSLVDAMRRATSQAYVHAVLGPCIHSECYEFGEAELATMVARYGPTLAARTAQGGLSLDLVAGVVAALAEVDVTVDTSASRCTACSSDLFSWRARQDSGRHAGVIWLES